MAHSITLNHPLIDELPANVRSPVIRQVEFRLTRIAEWISAYGRYLTQRGNKTALGITRLAAHDVLAENFHKFIDPISRKWIAQPPSPLTEISIHLSADHVQRSLEPQDLSLYRTAVNGFPQVPPPPPRDLARFIFDNCHDNVLLEIQLTCLSLYYTNISWPGHTTLLDALSLLYLRYPHPTRMSVLRIVPSKGFRNFSELLTAAGYDFVSEGGTNSLEQIKASIKHLLRLGLAPYLFILGIDDTWLGRLLVRPTSAQYGASVIPSLHSHGDWHIDSVLDLFNDATATYEDSLSTRSLPQLILSSAPRFVSAEFARSLFMDEPTALALSQQACKALLERAAAVFSNYIRVEGIQIIEDQAVVVVRFPLQGDLDDARTLLCHIEPFGPDVGVAGNGAPQIGTTPHECIAFDALRRRDLACNVIDCNGVTCLAVPFPTMA